MTTRRRKLRRRKTTEELQASSRIEVIERFSDKWWRINNLYYIQDEQARRVKFVCNPLQRKLWQDMWYCNILLKARQFGGTTFIDILFLDDCLFTSNLEAGIIAHIKDDAKKIFRRKIKYPYDNLPLGLREAVYLITDTTQELQFSNGSSIYVTNSVRSGTVQRLHISEYGKICCKYPDKAEEIKTGSLNAIHRGNIVWIESTAEGRFGDFFEKCQAARKRKEQGKPLTKLSYEFHFFPWYWDKKNALPDYEVPLVTISPELERYFEELEARKVPNINGKPHKFSPNQKAWYAQKLDEQGQDKMYREFPSTPDEAFNATIEGAYYAKEMTYLRKNNRITRVPWEPSVPVNTFWDLGMRAYTVIIYHQRVGLENRIIDVDWDNEDGLPQYVKLLQSKGYIYGKHILPHDVKHRSLLSATAKTRLQKLRELMPNEHIEVAPGPTEMNLAEGIQETKDFLLTCWIDEEKCDKLIRALDGYRRKPNELHGGFHSYPVEDWCCHFADAMRMGAIGYTPTTTTKRRRRRKRTAMVV